MNNIFINKNVWSKFSEDELNRYVDEVVNYYRETGFPYYSNDSSYRNEEFRKLFDFDLDRIVVVNDGKVCFKQTMHGLALAWSYFPHSWEVRCNGKRTPMEAFYTMLPEVVRRRIKTGTYMSDSGLRKMLKIFTGVQSVSNFRPTTAGALYNMFATNGTVLDMSSGFGGRLLGFIVSKANKYIGLEPSTKTFKGLCQLRDDYGCGKNIELFNIGSEDFDVKENSIDFCFTSPPYFDTEQYANEPTQSYIKFPTKELWLNGFLKKTFEMCYKGLKPGKFMAINVANVKSFTDLENNVISKALDVGFKLVEVYFYLLSSISHKAKFKSEPIYVFQKG